MGKYQLDSKGKAQAAKMQSKVKTQQIDKKQQIAKIREEYLKNKQQQAEK